MPARGCEQRARIIDEARKQRGGATSGARAAAIGQVAAEAAAAPLTAAAATRWPCASPKARRAGMY